MGKIKITSLLILFIIFCTSLCFSKESFSLSGKYKDYNVVLIIADSLRPDYLGCYGYARNVSPNIDSFTHKGIIFNNAFCQIPLTMPSIVSIFTSLYPESHGTFHVFKDGVPKNIYTLAAILKTYGYQTAWFGCLLDPHTGASKDVLKGFDIQQMDYIAIMKKGKIVNVRFDNMFQWLRKQNKKPIFLVVHTYMPHMFSFPFFDFKNAFYKEVSDLYNKWRERNVLMYEGINQLAYRARKEVFLWPAGKINTDRERALGLLYRKLNSEILGLNEEMFGEFLLYLESSIFEMDKSLIGHLIKELRDDNLAKKTIIIITSDHGDEHKEHRNLGHGPWLYDESIRVPLIFYIPGFDKAKKIDPLVQSIDILPTTLDLLGIAAPYQMQGVSLVSLIDGRKDKLDSQSVFSQTIDGKCMVRTKEWKFIDNANGNIHNELYNLKEDPKEQDNCISKDTEIAKGLQEQLLQWRKNLPVYAEDVQRQFTSDIDRETQERIRKIGYW